MADSLRNELVRHTEQDTFRVRLLNDYAYACFPAKPQQADSLAETALQLAEKLDYPSGRARAYYIRSIVKTVLSDFPNANRLAKLSRDLYIQIGDETGQATAYNTLGGVAAMEGHFPEALEYHLKALRIREKLGLMGDLAKSYTNVGMVYFYENKKEEALEYYFKAREIHEKEVPNPLLLASVENNIGVAYLDMDSLDLALQYFESSMKLNEELGILAVNAAILRNIGHIFRKKEQFDQAAIHFRHSVEIYEASGNSREMAAGLEELGSLYLTMGKLDSAKIFLNSALEESRRLGAQGIELGSLEGLYKLYRRTGESATALAYLENYTQLKDTLQSSERNKQFEELKIRYETEKNDADFALLRAREAESNASLERNRLVLAFIATVAALLLLVIIALWRSVNLQKRSNHILTQQKQILESQKAEIQLQKEAVEELSREKDALVGIVAHDLRAPLTRVEGLANIIASAGPLNEAQQSATNFIYRVTKEGGALIRDLLQVTAAEQSDVPVKYSEFDLNGYLRDLLVGHNQHAKDKNIELSCADNPEVWLVSTDREFLTRILDNLLDNALKFSPPGGKVEISASLGEKEFSVAIKDEGPGISKEEQAKMFRKFQKLSARPTGGEGSTGLGLSIIKALVEQLKGRVEVESKLGSGATFRVILPNSQG